MRDSEIKRYQKLNELAQPGGIAIFGGSEDTNIPICEFRQAFNIEENMYNRSFAGLSIDAAIPAYDACVSPILPETLFLHIGECDLGMLMQDPSEFDKKYCELINHIRGGNERCRIAVISLRNYENNPEIAEMNKHLRYIADSERCEFGDISARRVWNPKASMNAASFVRSIGFVHALRTQRPLYDLIQILFCSEVTA